MPQKLPDHIVYMWRPQAEKINIFGCQLTELSRDDLLAVAAMHIANYSLLAKARQDEKTAAEIEAVNCEKALRLSPYHNPPPVTVHGLVIFAIILAVFQWLVNFAFK